MAVEDNIRNYTKRLANYREHLSYNLNQVAMHGEASVPAHILGGITRARKEVAKLKLTLRQLGVEVEDNIDDDDDEGSFAAAAFRQNEVAAMQREKNRDILTVGGRGEKPAKRESSVGSDVPKQAQQSTPPPENNKQDNNLTDSEAKLERNIAPVAWLPNFADEHLRILENELMQSMYWEELGETQPLTHEYVVAKYFHLQAYTIQHLWRTTQEYERTIEHEDRVTEDVLSKMTSLLTNLHKKVGLIGTAMDTIPDYPLYIVIVEALRSVATCSEDVKSALLDDLSIEDICLTIHELASTLQEFERQLHRMKQHVAQEIQRVLGREQFEEYINQFPDQIHLNN